MKKTLSILMVSLILFPSGAALAAEVASGSDGTIEDSQSQILKEDVLSDSLGETTSVDPEAEETISVDQDKQDTAELSDTGEISNQVVVKYVSDSGESIAEDKIITDASGTAYDVTTEEFRPDTITKLDTVYDFLEIQDGSAETVGTTNDSQRIVTYVYSRVSSETSQTEELSEASDSIVVDSAQASVEKTNQATSRGAVALLETVTTLTTNDFDVANKETYISGISTSDVVRVKLEYNGVLLPEVADVGPDNTFTYYVGTQLIKYSSDKVNIIGYDAKGNQLIKQAVTILNGTSAPTSGAISVNQYSFPSDRKVTGTFSGDVYRVKLQVNGVLLAGVAEARDGAFSYYSGTAIQSISDEVYIIAYDKSGNLLTGLKVTIVKSNTTGTVKLDEFLLPLNRRVTGTYAGDVYRVKLQVNGVLLAGVAEARNGAFSYYCGSAIKSAQDEVYLIGYDKDGKQLDIKKVTVTQVVNIPQGTITPNSYTVGTDRRVTGFYTEDVYQIKIEVNGEILAPIAKVNEDGTFSYYAGSAIKKGYTVYVIGYAKTGEQLNRVQLNVN